MRTLPLTRALAAAFELSAWERDALEAAGARVVGAPAPRTPPSAPVVGPESRHTSLLEAAHAEPRRTPPPWLSWIVRELLHAYPERPASDLVVRTTEVLLQRAMAESQELFVWRLPLDRAEKVLAATQHLRSPIRRRPRGREELRALVDAIGDDIQLFLQPLESVDWPGVVEWPVPQIALGARPDTIGDLLSTLDLDPADADWLADSRAWNRRGRDARLDHYHRWWVAKRSGGDRLIEAPKPRLRRAQRALLDRMLETIPTHPAAFGFVRGRSARDHARLHAGRQLVLRFDLRDFFATVTASRVAGLLRLAGLHPPIARFTAALVTTSTPTGAMSHRELHPHTRACLIGRHLPQGAPSSPALANACAFRLDARLSGLASAFGARYSRYADDLTFSGADEFARRADGFSRVVDRVIRDEGFVPNASKTTRRRRGQGQRVTGLIVDDGVAVPRRERDRIEAILFNCVRFGPSSQRRERSLELFRDHLAGHVAHVAYVRPRHAARLKELFDRIDWTG